MKLPALPSFFKSKDPNTLEDFRRVREALRELIDYSGSIVSGFTQAMGDARYLLRSAGDFATFPTKTTPVSGDYVLVEDGAAGGAKKKVSATAFATPIVRDPIWDPPVTPHSDDDEFITDTFATGVWTVATAAGVVQTRIGDVDLATVVPGSNNFRSTLHGSTVLLQLPSGSQLYVFKVVSKPTSAFWVSSVAAIQPLGVLVGGGGSSAVTNDPLVAFFYGDFTAGPPVAPSFTNRSYVGYQTTAGAAPTEGKLKLFRVDVSAGVTANSFFGETEATNFMFPSGLAMWQGIVNTPTNTGNHGVYWDRAGWSKIIQSAHNPPVLGSNQIVGWQLRGAPSSNIVPGGIGDALFAFNFFRHKPASGPTGWLHG